MRLSRVQRRPAPAGSECRYQSLGEASPAIPGRSSSHGQSFRVLLGDPCLYRDTARCGFVSAAAVS